MMKTSLIRAGMVNFDQFCVSKLGRADERVHGEDCPRKQLIAFVVLDLTRSSVAAAWFCSAATVEISLLHLSDRSSSSVLNSSRRTFLEVYATVFSCPNFARHVFTGPHWTSRATHPGHRKSL
jgi:hypothetical protein